NRNDFAAHTTLLFFRSDDEKGRAPPPGRGWPSPVFGKADDLPIFNEIIYTGPDRDDHGGPGDDSRKGKGEGRKGKIVDHQGDDGDDLDDRLQLSPGAGGNHPRSEEHTSELQ